MEVYMNNIYLNFHLVFDYMWDIETICLHNFNYDVVWIYSNEELFKYDYN
jgi:hypothetical protein